MLSDLAREGITNSGSYTFADHLYRSEAVGRLVVGRWLDAALMRMPAGRAFRRRYIRARDAMHAAVCAWPAAAPVRVLTVPCGIPRDVVEMAATIERDDPARRIHYVGMDIDPQALRAARAFVAGSALPTAEFHCGDALRREHYPSGRFHVASSTGLGEFLDDADLETLCRNVFDVLEPGGTFFISATARDRGSDLLLRMIELETHYRSQRELEAIVKRLPWRRLTFVVDATGLQSYATLMK